MKMPEWQSLATVVERLRKKWTNAQNRFDREASIEYIALERVRNASMVNGVELLFSDINAYIDGMEEIEKNEREKEREVEKEERNVNPYRGH